MKCEYCEREINNDTDVCPNCKKDFDDSIRWFLEELEHGYYAKEKARE